MISFMTSGGEDVLKPYSKTFKSAEHLVLPNTKSKNKSISTNIHWKG